MVKKIFIVLAAILVMILLLEGGIFFLSPSKCDSSERIYTSEEISDLKEILLKGNFNINITSSDSRDIRCSFRKIKRGIVFGNYDFKTSIENNVLSVTTPSNKDVICAGGFQSLTLNIDIPKSYKNKLSIKSGLDKINILNSKSKDIECDTKDSNIKISLDNIAGNITVNSHLGDIDLKLPKDEKFNLSTESRLGDVTNNLKSNVDTSLKDKSIKLSSSDGNITINGN